MLNRSNKIATGGVVAAAGFLVATLAMLTAAQEPEGPQAIWPADRLCYASWGHSSVVTGFRFRKADYPVLASMTEVSDSTTVGEWPLRGIMFSEEHNALTCPVQRTVTLADPGHPDREVSVTVTVHGSSRSAAAAVWSIYRGTSEQSFDIYGPHVGIHIGDASLVSTLGWDWQSAFDEQATSGISFKRHNVWVGVSRSETSAVNVVALARLLCDEIDRQVQTQESMGRPTVTLAMLAGSCSPDLGEEADVPFTVFAIPSVPQAAVSLKHFIAEPGISYWNANGEWGRGQVDPRYLYELNEEFDNIGFDDAAAPTAVRASGKTLRRAYTIGVLAFEDNLLPAFAVDTLSVED